MEATTYIGTSKRKYYGVIILCLLFVLYEVVINNRPLKEIASGAFGIIAAVVTLYALYMIIFGKGKIILSESGFKIQGYSWTNWDDLASVYPSMEPDSENGTRHFISFRLKDGSDISIRSEHLEMTFEQIAELIGRYRTDYNSTKK